MKPSLTIDLPLLALQAIWLQQKKKNKNDDDTLSLGLLPITGVERNESL